MRIRGDSPYIACDVNLRRQRKLRLSRVLRQPCADPRLLLVIQPHSLFRPPPDGILKSANPLMLHQVFQLGFIELMAKIFAQIRYRGRLCRISSLLLP
jgi:hypothetical protein